MAAISQMW